MALWEDLTAQLRAEHHLELDEADEVALTLHRRDGEALRAQRLLVRHSHAWGRSMIEVRSAFGEAGDYDADHLLAENLHLPLGAIARHGQYLVLIQKACLEDLTLEGALFLIKHVGMLADVLEGRRGGDRF